MTIGSSRAQRRLARQSPTEAIRISPMSPPGSPRNETISIGRSRLPLRSGCTQARTLRSPGRS